MKTIRTNCFETNSSSTHSLTLDTTCQYLRLEETTSLSSGTTLFPGNIDSPDVLLRYYKYDPVSYIHTFTADTREAKAALIVHYLCGYVYGYGEEIKTAFINAVKDGTSYVNIEFNDDFSPNYFIDDYSTGDVDKNIKLFNTFGKSFREHEVLADYTAMTRAIREIVMDDRKVLVDKSEDY